MTPVQPMLAVRTLASGSSGNMTLVMSSRTTIAVDVGIGTRRGTLRALEAAGASPGSLDALLLSHSHSDHLGYQGLRLCVEAGVPVLGSAGVLRDAGALMKSRGGRSVADADFQTMHEGSTYAIGDIEVTPVVLPHDVPTFGYAFRVAGPSGFRKAVIATDLGHVPDFLPGTMADADILVIEANYDEGMLRTSTRHPANKARVSGPYGHLSNGQARDLLERILGSRDRPPAAVLLAHLSSDHNRPDLALQAVTRGLPLLEGAGTRVIAAPRARPGPLIRVQVPD